MFAEDVIFLVIKYLIEGLATSTASYFLSSKKASVQETVFIGITAATVFLLLDLFAPAVGSSSRTGAGLGIGLQRVGFEPFEAKKKRKRSPVVQGFTDADEPLEDPTPTPETYTNYNGFSY